LVFATGISNGGMMANRLACSDTRIKAMVAVSGGLTNGTDKKGETFECSRRVPMLHFHGLKDPVVPFKGCNHTFGGLECESMQDFPGIAPFPAIQDYVAEWRVRNGAPSGVGRTTFTNGTAICSSWGDVASNVTLCTLATEGHAWPGSCSTIQKVAPFMFNCSFDMDASEHAMAFFRQYVPPQSSSSSMIV